LFVLLFALFAFTGWLPECRSTGTHPLEPNAGPLVVRPPHPQRANAASQSIAGRVLGAQGYWQVNAEVARMDSGEIVQTDADGRFLFQLASPAPIDVRVRADGFRPVMHRIFPAAGEPEFFALEPAAPWDAALAAPAPVPQLAGEGEVHDKLGKGVANALVTVAGTSARARTDEFGRYRIPLPASEATLVVQSAQDGSARGLCARSELMRFQRTHGLVPLPAIVVEPGAEIRGTVRDAKGQPLAGVPVQLSGEGIVHNLESGTDGMYRIAGLLGGSYVLDVFGWRGALGTQQQVRLDRPAVDCDLQLLAAADCRLRVVTEKGEPVSGAVVATSVGGLRRSVVRADAQGWVELRTARTAAEYEVHAGEPLHSLQVRQSPNDGGDRLVVAAP
jgi:Carboxypeptidase regulatory-like domain